MWFALFAVALALVPRSASALVDPLPIISHFESSNGTDTSCSHTGACGIFQDRAQTWAEALGMIGVNPRFYPTANDAPASVQIAANNALINNRGLQPWLCPNCDAGFTAYVNSHGGIGAFQTSGLDTNPADFAQFDSDPAALQAFLNGGDGTVTGGGAGSPANSPTTPPAGAGAAAPSASVFSFLYDKIILNVTTRVSQMIDSARATMWPVFISLLALAVAVVGFRTLNGSFDNADFMFFVFRCAIVAGVMAPSSALFTDWIESPLLNLPTWFASIFDSNTNLSLTSPVTFFDSCAAGLYATALSVWKQAPWTLNMIPIGITIFFTYYLGYLSLFLLFLAFLFGNFLVFIIVIIAPFVIPALLFRATTGYFVGWLNTAVTALLTALLINVLLGLYFSLITDLIGSFSPSGSVHIDLPGYVGLVTGLLVMGVTVIFIPKLSHAIGHGVTASFDAASRGASGQMIVSHAAGAGRLLGKLG